MKFLVLFLVCAFTLFAEQQVLYLEGSAYERGLQHGQTLKTQIHHNLTTYITGKSSTSNPRIQQFLQNIPIQHIPKHFIEEMQGIADGADVPFKQILMLNLFPEMFHCMGMTAGPDTTADGKLYHVRALDYAIGKDLQNSAVVIIAKPDNGYAYLNVSYAGFVGSITGMNEKHISIGEIGGEGYGHWDGMPMAFLLREVLTKASSLEEAKELLSNAKRTCEYYYLIADGNTETATSVYATASQIHFVNPGEPYALFGFSPLPKNYGTDGKDDKFFFSPKLKQSPSQIQIHDASGCVGLIHFQPKDCLTCTGYGHPDRYPVLIDRIESQQGQLTLERLQDIIADPVGRLTNLHNAIFCPSTLDVWVSHAGDDGAPAYTQDYQHFNLAHSLSDR